MKIGILSRNPKLYSTRRLVEAGEKRGFDMHVVDVLRCYMNITSMKPTVHYKGQDLVGFDAISKMAHQSFSQALETSMICEIPFDTLDELAGKLPKLRQQIMRLMSSEITYDQEMLLLLNKKSAEERLASFIYNLSERFGERGFSRKEFRFTMTRGEIGNYLGLTVETISRLLSRFQKADLIKVEGKFITILDNDALAKAAAIVK